VEDNKIFQQTKLTIPVLAVDGEKSFGAMEATVMRNVATNAREAVVRGAGHWLMEENPTATIGRPTAVNKQHWVGNLIQQIALRHTNRQPAGRRLGKSPDPARPIRKVSGWGYRSALQGISVTGERTARD
jgi:shikimate kinase